MKPDISIYGSAYRPDLWMRFYNSIGDNKTTFEVIFAGPNSPDFILPDNFKHIKTNVKPAQCYEVAARQTTADLIMPVADDTFFVQKHPLDILYTTYMNYNNPKLILSCRYMLNGNDRSDTWHLFYFKDLTSLTMPLSGLMSRQLYMNIEGIDCRFIATMWDREIAIRVYALGGKVVLSNVYLNEERARGGGICQEFWEHDRKLLDRFWPNVNSNGPFNRTQPVESFSDYRILEESQGPKGRWI